jgi:histidine triad (HIT) family protein
MTVDSGASAEGCDFCEIARGEQEAEVVYESPETVAFLPLRPASYGHTLLIPRRHLADLFALDEHTAESLADSTLVVAHALRAALHPAGMNVINSSGEAASQTVFHIHVHLVPRWPDDKIGNIWPPSEPLAEKIEEDLAQRIRAEIARERLSASYDARYQEYKAD